MKNRILIVSSYRVRCGVASFAQVLRSQLEDDFDIDVAPLNQFLPRNKAKRAEEAGDEHIRQIAASAAAYDLVNLQWEPGLLGLTHRQIVRRLGVLMNANPRIVVTAHTVLPAPAFPDFDAFATAYAHTSMINALAEFLPSRANYHRRVYQTLRTAQRKGMVRIVAHTRRDRQFFEKVIGLAGVADHPLSHMDPKWVDDVRPKAAATAAELKAKVGPDTVLVGVFGFLSEYKSFETAIEALRLLPPHYHLLIFGGVHPESVRPRAPVDSYLNKLLSLVRSSDQKLGALAGVSAKLLRQNVDENAERAFAAMYSANGPLSDRVHWMGSPDDFEFAVALASADICVFPYLEVGQSGSGPVSQAIELGKKIIASNTKAFREAERYFPGRIRFFDVGNHVQLAQQIRIVNADPDPPDEAPAYDRHTQRAFYKSLFNEMLGRIVVARNDAPRAASAQEDRRQTPVAAAAAIVTQPEEIEELAANEPGAPRI